MIIYVPAILNGIEYQIRTKKMWRDHDASWFTHKCRYFHPQVLTSYYYSAPIPNYRERLDIRDDATLWVDSGGYTVATKKVELDPVKVLEWQEANADISYTLDYPPINIVGEGQTSNRKYHDVSLEQLRERAIKTAKNSEIFLKLRTSKRLKIYNIIHGVTLQYLEEWWKYNGDFPFEGFALGTKPAYDALHQASKLAFLHSKGVRTNVHMLGLSGVRIVPLLAYISQYVDRISFDSTSYGRGSLNRTYFFPGKLNDFISFDSKYKPNTFTLSCDCPICSEVQDAEFYASAGTWPGTLIALHNLYIMQDAVIRLNESLGDFDKFKSIVESMTGQKYEYSYTAKAIDLFNFYLKYGIDETYKRYFPNRDEEKCVQQKLF